MPYPMGPVKHTLLYCVRLLTVTCRTGNLPQTSVHETGSKRLLAARVPHADDEEVARNNRCFHSTEQDAKGNECGKVVGKSCSDENATPQQLNDKHQFCNGKAL